MKHPQMAIDYVDPRSLRFAPHNPRTMDKAEMAKLKRSIRRWGMVDPVVIRRKGMEIIGGHQRVTAAIEEGLDLVPAILLDLDHKEAKALNLALNRIQGEWDLPKLGRLLEELRDLPDIDESLTGFDPPELDEILAGLEAETALGDKEEFDLAAAVARKARNAPRRVQPGQHWQLGRHRLLCGDSFYSGNLGRLCERRPPDIVLTDPPYGIDYDSQTIRRSGESAQVANDESANFPAFIDRALSIVRGVMPEGSVLYLFAGGGGSRPVLAHAMLAVARHFNLLNVLVWDKQVPGMNWRWRFAWEAIIEASVGQPACWHGGNERGNVLQHHREVPRMGGHPTPKPVPLLAEILRAASAPNSVVLDPFLGMGSTLIAAEQTGRSCLGVELDPYYCELTLERWEALTGGKAEVVSGA